MMERKERLFFEGTTHNAFLRNAAIHDSPHVFQEAILKSVQNIQIQFGANQLRSRTLTEPNADQDVKKLNP
ncbi:hypothetical protein RJT34_17298 [Clitoria ternatea]|uniref:Uncharacterized protein n=1 Tax=Clitoria ternatea TaxID=43366 RepID=A0AAN9PEF8_CLITE